LAIAQWSTARVVGVSLIWVVLVIGYHVARFMVVMRAVNAQGHIAGISGSLSGLLRMGAIVFIPPFILVLVWLAQRRQM
jgi:hypothetical protein